MDPLVRWITGITGQVLREIADAIDSRGPATTEQPVVVHIAHLTINEAPTRKLFGRNPT
ncbi:hypothetical protein [Rhodococcus sp. UNC363MFTsu5.1]|uniref:hypothetical protein n=1 Tax=Rhodococcus sp. UNC363MFTsu5.1 TaxID=1449069 RepID=UPI000A5827BB|nr:hypothetical protein [Rhodococcus sp. UNC363MFTsu5.1]